jgi:hypothetical protein
LLYGNSHIFLITASGPALAHFAKSALQSSTQKLYGIFIMQCALSGIIDLEKYPLQGKKFRSLCRQKLEDNGVLVMPDFLLPSAIQSIRHEGEQNQHLAYYTQNKHTVFLTPQDPAYPAYHPCNREITSSKGCITTDQIPDGSALKYLYNATSFREFLCAVLDQEALHEYADTLSSINLHFASTGQELGWHFDNASFAITLMIQPALLGGVFEFVKNVRNAETQDISYAQITDILDGATPVNTLSMDAGALVLFRGQNAIHRVTPVSGNRTRMLAVLAYNAKPGIALSESARMTFFGRL